MRAGLVLKLEDEPDIKEDSQANLVLSHHPECKETCSEECAVKGLDDHSGILKSGSGQKSKNGTCGYFVENGHSLKPRRF